MRAAKLHIVLLDHQRILYVLRSASCLQLVHYLLQSTSANVVAGIASSAAPTISVRISIFEASFRHRHGAFLFANPAGETGVASKNGRSACRGRQWSGSGVRTPPRPLRRRERERVSGTTMSASQPSKVCQTVAVSCSRARFSIRRGKPERVLTLLSPLPLVGVARVDDLLHEGAFLDRVSSKPLEPADRLIASRQACKRPQLLSGRPATLAADRRLLHRRTLQNVQ